MSDEELPPLSQQVLLAVHTHLIVRAQIDEQLAKSEARQARAAARAAGVCPRVVRRAVRMMNPNEQKLDQQAAALVEVLQRVPIGMVVVPGALSPDAPRPILTPPDCEAAA